MTERNPCRDCSSFQAAVKAFVNGTHDQHLGYRFSESAYGGDFPCTGPQDGECQNPQLDGHTTYVELQDSLPPDDPRLQEAPTTISTHDSLETPQAPVLLYRQRIVCGWRIGEPKEARPYVETRRAITIGDRSIPGGNQLGRRRHMITPVSIATSLGPIYPTPDEFYVESRMRGVRTVYSRK